MKAASGGMRRHILFTAVVSIVANFAAASKSVACDSSVPASSVYPFCRLSIPVKERVEDLVSRLTLDEKISQLGNSASSIPRYGIPAYQWWGESLHGVASTGYAIHFNGLFREATSFPQVILTAASFDRRLWHRIGQAIGIEARALYNAGQATGLTFWAPNINIFRDPRWGRGQETPGEDPMVASQYAEAFVRGLQGDDAVDVASLDGEGRRLQASACCKHFTAYDLDRWRGIDRFNFNAVVTPQDMADTYQPPFQSCVELGRASGIMCGYNRVNGVPSCANYELLTSTARRKWRFQGYITSDCDAVSIIHDVQGYAATPEDAVADVLKAGMDVNCGSYLQNYTKSAIQKNKISEADVDRALHNLFSVRMWLGLFDSVRAAGTTSSEVCSGEHRALALDAARAGIVLLKNSNRLLPVARNAVHSLAVLGPVADSPIVLRGNYFGPGCKNVTILKALRSYVPTASYHSACNDVGCSDASINQAMGIAQRSGIVVLVMGLDQSQESEDRDRQGLELPGEQQRLIEKVAGASRGPVLLVLLCGGPVDVEFAKTNDKIGGIIWAGYPGEAGAIALAEVIFGDHNPGGKLPVTWYRRDFTRIPMTDMRMRPEALTRYPGRTYRFYRDSAVFEFGYGLSYSNYSYEFIHVSRDTFYLNTSDSLPNLRVVDGRSTGFCSRNKFSVVVEVENHGSVAGVHPILLFLRPVKYRDGRPIKQLVAFQSVSIGAGKKHKVGFELGACEHLRVANEEGVMIVEEGSYVLTIEETKFPLHVVRGD